MLFQRIYFAKFTRLDLSALCYTISVLSTHGDYILFLHGTTPFEEKKRFLVLDILLTLFLLAVISVYLIIPLIKYNIASANFKRGEYLISYDGFTELNGYFGSEKRADESIEALFLDELQSGDYKQAIEYYDTFPTLSAGLKNRLSKHLYDFASEIMYTSRYEEASEIFMHISHYEDSLELLRETYIHAAEKNCEIGNFTACCEIMEKVERPLGDAEEKLLFNSKKGIYDLAVAMDPQNMVSYDVFKKELDGFLDIEKYRTLYNLQKSSWETEEHDENLKNLYALGDFMEAKQNQFIFLRLFGRTFKNENGRYFSMDLYGNISTNIPKYQFHGYYGLYGMIENNVYYTGSDEKKWTPQFRFYFDDLDRTIEIYSYTSGGSYTLYLSEIQEIPKNP
jgi:hypothetical protein